VCARVLMTVGVGAQALVCAWKHVALLIQHATRMRHIVTSFVAPLAPPYFLTLSHKRQDIREDVTEYKICVLVFCITLFETFLVLRRFQRDIVINVTTSSYKVSVILVGF
jgi:hypothetical protein